jgi:hypothetical protein
VGTLAGTDAVVGIVSRGSHVSFYLCGGASTYGTLTHWFGGTLTNGSLHATTTDGPTLTLDGTLDADGVTGTLTISGGEVRTWTAHPVNTGTLEGLYATIDDGCRTGVVVTQSSAAQPPSVQGTWCNAADEHLQVTPMHPVQLVDGALAVQVEGLPGAHILHVAPLELTSP